MTEYILKWNGCIISYVEVCPTECYRRQSGLLISEKRLLTEKPECQSAEPSLLFETSGLILSNLLRIANCHRLTTQLVSSSSINNNNNNDNNNNNNNK